MGNTGSKGWPSFGAELLELDEKITVHKSDLVALHRFNVVDIVVKEYILRHVAENFSTDELLKDVWFSTAPCGSWIADTNIWSADTFDINLIMDNVPGVPTSQVTDGNLFTLQVMSRRPVDVNRDSAGSDRETGENFHNGIVFVSNPVPGESDNQTVNMGPKYVTENVDFPIERVKRHIYDSAERFTSHDPQENFWLSRLHNVDPHSLTLQVQGKDTFAVTMKLSWIDIINGTLQEASVKIIPAYRNINKKFGDFFAHPPRLNNPETLLGKLKEPILSTPLFMTHDPERNGWIFNNSYVQTVVFDHLRRWIPNAVAAFRLVKVLRDAKLPWCCQRSSESEEPTGVRQFISSNTLLNIFLHELSQESEFKAWEKEKIYYRLLGMLQKLYGLTNYMPENWDSQADFFLPTRSPPMDKLHPIGSDIQHLIGLLSLRNQQYQKGSASKGKECACCCHSATSRGDRGVPHDVHDNPEHCVNDWNHPCFLQYRRPLAIKKCNRAICRRTKSSTGPQSPRPKKKVRLREVCTMEKMQRHLPGGKVSLLIATMNMMEQQGPSSLNHLLLAGHWHDIYVIGTQETSVDRRTLEDKIQQTLGDNYGVLFSETHWALSLHVFMKKELLPFTSEPDSDQVTLNPRVNWFRRTKGAIGVCFQIFGTSFLFVNAHLSPHTSEMKKRVGDFEQISSEMSLPNKDSNTKDQAKLNARFDNAFWFGDLNFRMTGGKKLWSQPNVDIGEMLANYDELKPIQKEGVAFQGFKEGTINFPPTYKYEPNTPQIKMKRPEDHPSYTDRILYRCADSRGVRCLHYDSVLSLMESDHRPVHGVYEIAVKPSPDHVGECVLPPENSAPATASPVQTTITAPTDYTSNSNLVGPSNFAITPHQTSGAIYPNLHASHINGPPPYRNYRLLVGGAAPPISSTGGPKRLPRQAMPVERDAMARHKKTNRKHGKERDGGKHRPKKSSPARGAMAGEAVHLSGGGQRGAIVTAYPDGYQPAPTHSLFAGDLLLGAGPVQRESPPKSSALFAPANDYSPIHSQSVPSLNDIGRRPIPKRNPPPAGKGPQTSGSALLTPSSLAAPQSRHKPGILCVSEAMMDFGYETMQHGATAAKY